jgi:hypothetical protein
MLINFLFITLILINITYAAIQKEKTNKPLICFYNNQIDAYIPPYQELVNYDPNYLYQCKGTETKSGGQTTCYGCVKKY